MKLAKILAFGIIIFTSLLLLSGCSKISENEILPIETITSLSKIDKIKNWYYSSVNDSSNVSARTISNADWRAGQPQWDKTKSYTLSGNYITPIGYYGQNFNTDKFIYKFLITTENPEGEIASGMYVMLFIKKEILLSDSFIVSETLISPEFLKMNLFSGGFAGEIVRYNLDYSLVSSDIIDPVSLTNTNNEVKIVYKIGGVKHEVTENALNRLALACGECVDWYEETYNPETGQVYSQTFLYTECGECDDAPSGGGMGGGSGGTGTGPTNPCPTAPLGYNIIPRIPQAPNTPEDPNDPCGAGELEEDEDVTCPNNFVFVPVTTNSLWQEAKLTSVYSNLVFVGFGGSSKSIQIPQLSFGLPYYNQDGDIMFSHTQAKNIAAVAFDLAERDLRAHFKNFPYLTTQQLKTFWINRMDLYMKASTFGQGKVSTVGSVNPINPVPGIPYDPIGGGGPC